MRIGCEPHFRLSSAPLPKSEIAVVLELSDENKKGNIPLLKKRNNRL